jgi:hypothetical protein
MLLFQNLSWKSDKKRKRVSMFIKLSSKKISSTFCQGISKKQKQNSNVCQAECRKGNADDYLAIEKAKSKRTEEMELA